jgi:hypothetical protein
MWEDRVSGKADGADSLSLLHALTRAHQYAPGLHVYQQAALAILVVDQYEVTDVFRVFACRKLGMSDHPSIGIFKPVVGDVIG